MLQISKQMACFYPTSPVCGSMKIKIAKLDISTCTYIIVQNRANEGLSRNFKTHRTKNDYHTCSWKELVEINKNVKFGKDRFTNCEDMNFQKSKFCMKTFGNLRW